PGLRPHVPADRPARERGGGPDLHCPQPEDALMHMLKRIAANKTALTGAIISALVAVAVVLGPMISPYDSDAMDMTAMLAPPSLAHPFGTDTMGRDVLTRVLYGARLSLLISISGVGIAAVIGSMI